MRTKILLGAAAALAAGVVASNAQVYSANVVGYVNVVYPAGQLVLAANPLTTGNDVLTNVLQGVPGASHLYFWNGTGWATYQYSGVQHTWKNGAVDVSNTQLPPGLGFFFSAATTFTNTYVGSVAAATGGGTVTNSLLAAYQPVGSKIPYADVVTNAATFNLTVGGASILQTWNVGAQSYDPPYQYSGVQHVWKQGSTVTNPVVQVGQGFFISPSAATNWVQTLQ